MSDGESMNELQQTMVGDSGHSRELSGVETYRGIEHTGYLEAFRSQGKTPALQG